MDEYYLRISIDGFNSLQSIRDKQKQKPLLCQCGKDVNPCHHVNHLESAELSECGCCGRLVTWCFMGGGGVHFY